MNGTRISGARNAPDARVMRGERDAEVVINNFRMALSLIYCAGVLTVALLQSASGMPAIPARAHAGTALFALYSFMLFFYLRRRARVSASFKYICVIADTLIISLSICVTCTYPERFPPMPGLSFQALLYLLLIILGAFRYNVRCVLFSGIFSAVCYAAVIIINIKVIDIPYTAYVRGENVGMRFFVYYEAFRILGFAVAGVVTGMACRRQGLFFSGMLRSENEALRAAGERVARTRDVAKTVRQAAGKVFVSSKDIVNTANSQAASVREIESTINENARIAGDIAEKTGSVSNIASRMERDVQHGFSALKNNIEKMSDIKEKNDGVINGIVSLGDKIIRIRDIVKTINTITGQTKVIAFNAALEAAGAGGKGRRFAVVAGEINRLASDIETLTTQIKDQVKEIQDSSSALIVSGEESAGKIQEGGRLINELGDIFCEIRSGAEITAGQAQNITVLTQKQQKSIEQIHNAIGYISTGLGSFIHSTEGAAAAVEELIRLALKMDAILSAEKPEALRPPAKK